MRRKLLYKIIICYFLITIPLFILFNTYGIRQIHSHCIAKTRSTLYNYSKNIKEKYFLGFYSNTISTKDISQQLEIFDAFCNTLTWIVNAEGEIKISSEQNFDFKNPIPITDFSSDFLGKSYHVNTDINGLLKEPMLSVILPITIGFDIKGYIVVHTPMSSIYDSATYYINFINIVYLTLSILLLLGFAYLYFITIIPLKKIIKATTAYSTGQYDYALTITSKDEYADLSNSLIYMAGELSNLDDYQKKFVANISHDFRSPLTSIKGYAEAMLDGTIPFEMQGKYLDIILFEAERLTKLTTNLLALNSFENNGVLLDITSFDINHTIKRTAASFEGTCTKKHIKLKLIFSEKQTFIDADIGKIQQVLYNLLDNAIKFSNIDSEIHITTTEKKDKVLISIKDFGIGIPKDSQKKVWERFYKTDVSRGKDKKGTGLGLSITKEIINAHGENINVVSTEGVGTEFIFTLHKTLEED